jgi:hypothetical protein
MRNWILLILLFFGLFTRAHAHVDDVHDSYKESFSSVVGFFGEDMFLHENGKSEHSKLQTHYLRTHVVNNHFRGFDSDLIPEFGKSNFYFFSIYLYKKVESDQSVFRTQSLLLFKLFNNYRI